MNKKKQHRFLLFLIPAALIQVAPTQVAQIPAA